MKTSMKWLLGMVLSIALVTSCKKDNPSNSQGSVVFKFQSQGNPQLKSTVCTGPVAAAIIISIEKQGGGVVYNKEKLELSYLNGAYLTKGLPLPVGNYNLTEFLVTDVGNHVIYATPKAGSDLARLVSNPLPISFNAQAGIENILVPEVISTDSSSLKDLGYEGFSFNPVKTTNFLVTILAKDPQNPNFEQVDSVNLSLWTQHGNYTHILKKGVNVIALPLILPESYEYIIIYVWKRGYTSSMTYWDPGVLMDRLKEYANTPFQIILTPINVPSISCWGSGRDLSFFGPTITTRSVHTFYADYGDGKSDTITASSANFSRSPDFYGNRLLQIWGSVDDIKSVDFSGQRMYEAFFTDIDLSSATTLEDISFAWANIDNIRINKQSLKNFSSSESKVPFLFSDYVNLESINITHYYPVYQTIDIRTNDKLKSLSFDGGTVLFGANPDLTSIQLSDAAWSGTITSEMVNALLVALLASVEKAPRVGSFGLYNYNQAGELNLPTNEGMQAAQTLKTKYNWTFNFEVK